MADVRPFKALRPAKDKASHIAALPYDVMNTAEAKAEIEREPLSFLRIDRPETSFPDGQDMYAPEVYAKANEIFEGMIKDGSFIQDDRECYYIYELTMDGRTQTGITAVCSCDDYEDQVIKKHENTLAAKEQDRIRHISTLSAQTGPIFLSYRRNASIDDIVSKRKKDSPVYDFTSDDGISHRVWIIDDEADIKAVCDAFSGIDSIYIADGHHRCASAVKVCKAKRSERTNDGSVQDSDYFLSVLFPDAELKILDYNRVVKDLNGYTEEAFLERISEDFDMTEVSLKGTPYRPEEKGTFGMFLGGKWYKLQVKDAPDGSDPVKSLDVSVLQDRLLEPVLGIHNPKTDTRIDFIGGIRGLGELERRVSLDMTVAFSMFPTSMEELFRVADAGLLMPPKSTWFEPKLLSGIFIHEIER